MSTYGERLESALSQQVKVELAERDWKQRDLAEALEMHEAMLSRYLNNRVAWPMPVFVRIAEALDLTAAELMTRAQARIDS